MARQRLHLDQVRLVPQHGQGCRPGEPVRAVQVGWVGLRLEGAVRAAVPADTGDGRRQPPEPARRSVRTALARLAMPSYTCTLCATTAAISPEPWPGGAAASRGSVGSPPWRRVSPLSGFALWSARLLARHHQLLPLQLPRLGIGRAREAHADPPDGLCRVDEFVATRRSAPPRERPTLAVMADMAPASREGRAHARRTL